MRYLYVIKGGHNHYKIGIANNVRDRLKNLQTSNAQRLYLIASRLFENAEEIEHTIHSMLQKYATGGGQEWFELVPEELIKVLKMIHEFPDVHVTDRRVMLEKILDMQADVTGALNAYLADLNDIQKMKNTLQMRTAKIKPIAEAEKEIMQKEQSDEEDLLKAKAICVAAGKASTSLLQREMRIGYSKAARLLSILEDKGIVSVADGMRARIVYPDEPLD